MERELQITENNQHTDPAWKRKQSVEIMPDNSSQKCIEIVNQQ